MEMFSLILSKDLLLKNKDLLLSGNYVYETKSYYIILGFLGYYFLVNDVIPKDITISSRKFKFTYSVFSDTVSIDIYFNELL